MALNRASSSSLIRSPREPRSADRASAIDPAKNVFTTCAMDDAPAAGFGVAAL
jgi:hypothetical protein